MSDNGDATKENVKDIVDDNVVELEEIVLEGKEELIMAGISCKTINDKYFARLRRHFNIPDDFAAATSSFSFDKLVPGGGKGGDPMVRTSCGKYFIKEMNRGDHETLMALTEDMCSHCTDKSNPSLLVPILTQFWGKDQKKSYMAMLNCMASPGPYIKMYDLKGCADDKLLVNSGDRVVEVHKRVWNLNLWCGCGGESRANYFQGKLEALHAPQLEVSLSQKTDIMTAIRRDTAWLQKHNLMDFSLLVGVVQTDPEHGEPEGRPKLYAGAGFSVATDGGNRTTYFGIIDFLQRWNSGKAVAKAIKFSERNKATVPPPRYCKRFVEHFDRVIIAVDKDMDTQIKARETAKMPHRCFPLARK